MPFRRNRICVNVVQGLALLSEIELESELAIALERLLEVGWDYQFELP
jgi:hypothetical protein